MSSEITELYDHEIHDINALTYKIMKKYEKRELSKESVAEMEKEIVGRFFDLGFHVEVDFLSWLVDQEPAPTIIVNSRVNVAKEFDYDKKRYEVLQDRKLNG